MELHGDLARSPQIQPGLISVDSAQDGAIMKV